MTIKNTFQFLKPGLHKCPSKPRLPSNPLLNQNSNVNLKERLELKLPLLSLNIYVQRTLLP